ncbi:MAG: hypothetical protein RID42_06380 [Alphaproteobacteria bacterium]
MGQHVDVRKLSKVLAMTTSDSDGEALSAARKAAAIVTGAGLTYDTLFTEHLPKHYEGVANTAWVEDHKQSWLARALIRKLQNEIAELRRQTNSSTRSGTGNSEGLRQRLLSSAPLNNWERSTLDRIESIQPKSKEEYYILWLARRYQMQN